MPFAGLLISRFQVRILVGKPVFRTLGSLAHKKQGFCFVEAGRLFIT